MEELQTDPVRIKHFSDCTGIFVRAKVAGIWSSVDIATLTCASLKTWLRSRGGENTWAETALAITLGHTSEDISKQWPT